MKMASTIGRKIVHHFNKKRKKMGKKVMNVVAIQMSSSQLHDPCLLSLSPRLSSMATTGFKFEAEMLWDYFDLDRDKTLNTRQEQAGSTFREKDLEGNLRHTHGKMEEEE